LSTFDIGSLLCKPIPSCDFPLSFELEFPRWIVVDWLWGWRVYFLSAHSEFKPIAAFF
jgi:hypothetical protein